MEETTASEGLIPLFKLDRLLNQGTNSSGENKIQETY